MEVIGTALAGVRLLRPRVFRDERGFFLESWNARTFATLGVDVHFVQDNHSRSAGGTLRGIHYQAERPQGKLVRVARGRVYDVAVDLRRSSPTFGQWFGTELSEDNQHQLWVPPGFGHGFYVMSDAADFLYKCTDFYVPALDRSLRWDDPTLAIDWPIPAGETPLLSDKDLAAPLLADAELYD